MSVAKSVAALAAVQYVTDGMLVGLGTGTTAHFAIEAIGNLVRQGLQIEAVASSIESEKAAAAAGIKIIPFDNVSSIDIYIDGADEIDAAHNLIKGGGGALLREKILACNSKRFVVIADQSKLVRQLGAFRLPVEVVQFAWQLTAENSKKLGGKPQLRLKNEEPFVTDNGNYILDCDFGNITVVEELNANLHNIPGVVETGLFPSTMVREIIIGKEDGSVAMRTIG